MQTNKIPNRHFGEKLRIFLYLIYQEVGEERKLDSFEIYFLVFPQLILWYDAKEHGNNWKNNNQKKKRAQNNSQND